MFARWNASTMLVWIGAIFLAAVASSFNGWKPQPSLAGSASQVALFSGEP